MVTPRIVLLIGFDRSGSSMVSKLLARHPDVSLLFQPFNSSEVHRAQWTIWPPEQPAPRTEAFLRGLLEGHLDRSYVHSDWFWEHSTDHDVDPARVNLIKDTKLHFQVPWLAKRFPELELCALWRDPRGILCSLLRNDFYRRWYGDDAFAELRDLVQERDELAAFRPALADAGNDLRRMAAIVAVRSAALFRAVPPERQLDYEAVVADPDAALAPALARWGLPPFRFSDQRRPDENVVGLPFERTDLWRDFLPDEEQPYLDALFSLVRRAE